MSPEIEVKTQRKRKTHENQSRKIHKKKSSRKKPRTKSVRTSSRVKTRNKIAFGKIFGRTFIKRMSISIGVALLVVLSLLAFLRVRTVSVVGNTRYSVQEIQQATGVTEGNALLMINKTAVASRIKAQLPYIDEVRIGISLPDTVKVEVVELEIAYAVAADDGSYWLINSSGRLVEQLTAKDASEYLTIKGVRICNAAVGGTVEIKEEVIKPEQDSTEESQDEEEDEELYAPAEASAKQRMDVALEIIQQLERVDDIRAITSIDVSSIYDLEIWYGTRFQVKLGDNSNLSYKLEYMVSALSQLESYQSGVLDLTFEEAKKATFIPWSN